MTAGRDYLADAEADYAAAEDEMRSQRDGQWATARATLAVASAMTAIAHELRLLRCPPRPTVPPRLPDTGRR